MSPSRASSSCTPSLSAWPRGARLWFRRGSIAVNVHGMIVWSTPLEEPKPRRQVCLSIRRVRVESSADEFAQTLDGAEQPSSSPARCRLTGAQSGSACSNGRRAPRPTMKILRRDTEIPGGRDSARFNRPRERLATHPDEALKWYNRARLRARRGRQPDRFRDPPSPRRAGRLGVSRAHPPAHYDCPRCSSASPDSGAVPERTVAEDTG